MFVWTQLTKGDPNYTLVQISVNDIVMVFAFAPLTATLLGISGSSVPWETLSQSVTFYGVLGVWWAFSPDVTLNKAILWRSAW